MNGPNSLPDALRAVAANLHSAANDLARVLNSVASALEPASREGTAAERPKAAPTERPSPATAAKKAPVPTAAKTASAPTAAKTASRRTAASAPKPVTDQALRAAMQELGAATAPQIAGHINAAAGRRVVDGRAIRGHAQRLGARVVMRRGERLYRL